MRQSNERLSLGGRIFRFPAIWFFLFCLGPSPLWAQFIVTTTDDAAVAGSLRSAITAANMDPNPNTITFDPAVFPAGAPATINVGSVTGSRLPAMTGSGDSINGVGAGVILDGSSLPDDNSSIGLRVRASDITIQSLTLQNFPGDGIQVDAEGLSAIVTGVLITGNVSTLNRRGILITGGTGPGKTVGATVSANNVSNNAQAGITARGNNGNAGGNTVDVVITGNNVSRSKQAISGIGNAFGGDGIQIVGGVNAGSGNTVTALVSNNVVFLNRDDGIVAPGCGIEDSGANNTVNVTIINNDVKDNGVVNPDLARNAGIAVSGASGEEMTETTCFDNIIRFLIANNVVTNNRTANISVNGGTGSGHDVQGIVSGNVVRNSPEGNGINVSGGGGDGNHVHDVMVIENIVSKNFNLGISVSGGAGVNAMVSTIDILANQVTGDKKKGLQARGIQVSGGMGDNTSLSDIFINGNSSTNNTEHGINVTSGSGTNTSVSLRGITNNTANSNGRDGIGVRTNVPGSGATPISGNRADRNSEDGIDILSTGYTLSNNRADRNAVDGIDAAGNTDGGGNTARRNASCNTPGCF